MPKPPVSYDEALRPTAIILTPILTSPLPWACSARWMKREPLQRRDLRSIQVVPSVACDPSYQATMRLISLDESAFVRACAWPRCRRGDVAVEVKNRK